MSAPATPAVAAASIAAASTGATLTPGLMYRRLVKMYLRKFRPNYKFIVHAVRQTKFEFYQNANAPKEDVPAMLERAAEIQKGIEFGMIPVVKNGRGELVGKVNHDMFAAGGGVVEPLSLQDGLLRLQPQISDEEFQRSKEILKQLGRWEDRAPAVQSIKTKVAKCTDRAAATGPVANDEPPKPDPVAAAPAPPREA